MFRTIEISDRTYERNHLKFITVKSHNLRGRGDICVFVPPVKTNGAVPLILLLHGVYGSCWVWSQKAGVHFTALAMMEEGLIPPMVIAMPSDGLWGDGSGYLSHVNGANYEEWIVEDVPEAVAEATPLIGSSPHLFIAGLSMGGFGALRLGIKYREKFKAISAHSAITDVKQMPLFVEEPLDAYLQADAKENSILGLLSHNRENLPKIRFDCGLEDQLLEPNRELHANLLSQGVPHDYREFPGGHEWVYWSEHVKDTLQFFGSCVQ